MFFIQQNGTCTTFVDDTLPTGRGLTASTISIYLQYQCVYTLLPPCGLESYCPHADMQIIVSRPWRGASWFQTVLPFSILHLSVLSNCFYFTNGANIKFS